MSDPIVGLEPEQITLAGSAVTVAVEGLGYLGTRKSRPDGAAVLVDAAVKLAQAAAAENDNLHEAIAALRAEVDEVRSAVEMCERKHAAAEAALKAAGIIHP